MIENPIFIGGAPRSGTTLLRVMLDSHPNILCGPELRAFPALASFSSQLRRFHGSTPTNNLSGATIDAAFRDLCMSFLRPYHRRQQKKRIAEKTPANVLHFEELERLFPDGQFIHVVRDGRDVVASLLGMDWRDSKTGAPQDITQDPEAAARAWATHVQCGLAAERTGAAYRIHYEQLVCSPEETLRPLLDFLGEPWSPSMLDFHQNPSIALGENESSAGRVSQPLDRAAIGRWRHALAPATARIVEDVAGPLLQELGYGVIDER